MVLSRVDQLRSMVAVTVETDQPAVGYDGPPVGLVIISPGADRIRVAATWFPHLEDGGFMVMEPFSDDQKRQVVEQRLGLQSIEEGMAVFYP